LKGRRAMEVRSFVIKNKLGLHARAAGLLVQKANQFACDIKIEKDGLEVNAKSIMGVMMLAAAKDSRVTLQAEGADAQQALQALGDLFEGKFGEE
jgi:phosphocarrier protein HPr